MIVPTLGFGCPKDAHSWLRLRKDAVLDKAYLALWGYGMPWVIMVLSSATTGRWLEKAEATSGENLNKSEERIFPDHL